MRACMRTTCGFHLRPEAPTHERKPTKMMSYEELVDFARVRLFFVEGFFAYS